MKTIYRIACDRKSVFAFLIFSPLFCFFLLLASEPARAGQSETPDWIKKFNKCINKGSPECKKRFPPKEYDCSQSCSKHCKGRSFSEPDGYSCYMTGDGAVIPGSNPCRKSCNCILKCNKSPTSVSAFTSSGTGPHTQCEDPLLVP